MELIIGGAYQGKLRYVRKKFNLNDEEILFCNEQNPEGKRAVCGFHLLVRQWLVDGLIPLEETRKISAEIIICDEIGNGIVPMDSFERQWREECGRCCTALAKKADTVTRIFCSLPTKIKG
ncbi:MAG TPA: cobalamin biosynthesis protein CobU [Lachnospiraceae bacterium]|nr:cobalamin biosynthesis protein CobU [Lachnospiraceae bacterium]